MRKNILHSALARGESLVARQSVRFLLAGGFNTVWGYGSFALLYYLLSRHIHYFVILTIANVINVTVSFVTYKLFVFRTQGAYLREYFRFYIVNALPIILGYVLFPILKECLRVNPYLAQALIFFITIIVSYFGHKHFSFARPQAKRVAGVSEPSREPKTKE